MAKATKQTQAPPPAHTEAKAARFIRFPPSLDAWLSQNYSTAGFKNVNQFVVDLVRREWQHSQAS